MVLTRWMVLHNFCEKKLAKTLFRKSSVYDVKSTVSLPRGE